MFYPEISANDAQRQEWVDLLSINEIETDPAFAQVRVFGTSGNHMSGTEQHSRVFIQKLPSASSP